MTHARPIREEDLCSRIKSVRRFGVAARVDYDEMMGVLGEIRMMSYASICLSHHPMFALRMLIEFRAQARASDWKALTTQTSAVEPQNERNDGAQKLGGGFV